MSASCVLWGRFTHIRGTQDRDTWLVPCSVLLSTWACPQGRDEEGLAERVLRLAGSQADRPCPGGAGHVVSVSAVRF